MAEATPKDAARWMQEKLESSRGYLDQEVAAYGLRSVYGESFTYVNENGNLAINRSVLREFRLLTEDAVVWSRSERAWRRRHAGDLPGSRQAY